MKNLIRLIFYFLHNLYLNFTLSKVKISLSSKIKPSSKISRFVKVNKNVFFDGDIGEYSYIGKNSTIYGKIGRFCSIGENVSTVISVHPTDFISTSPVFYSTSGQAIDYFVEQSVISEIKYVDNTKFPVIIENDVWIGNNVLIKGGVRIGNGAIIAMGSVVSKDVEPYAIVGGIPAKTIRYRFNPQEIEQLLKIKWWDKGSEWLKSNASLFLSPTNFFNSIKSN